MNENNKKINTLNGQNVKKCQKRFNNVGGRVILENNVFNYEDSSIKVTEFETAQLYRL